MEVVLFCSLWKSYWLITFLPSMEVVLFCSPWKSYFFALYGSRKVLLCMEVVLFCSVCTRTFFLRVSLFSPQSYFFPLNRTFFLSVVLFFLSVVLFFLSVVLFSSASYFFPLIRTLLFFLTFLLSRELAPLCSPLNSYFFAFSQHSYFYFLSRSFCSV